MNKDLHKHLLITLCFLMVTPCVSFAQEWEKSKSDNDVVVLTKERDNGIKEVKIKTEVNAPLDKVVKFITDYNNPKEWKHSTRKSEIVKKISDTNFKVYFVIGTPWPLKDRDFYADVIVNHNKGGKKCEIIFTPDVSQEKNGNKVRMTEFDTRWIIEEVTPSSCKVELYSYGDPVGVPTSFVNMFIVDTPLKTVKNLKKDIVNY